MTAPSGVWCAHTWQSDRPCTTSTGTHRCRLAHIHGKPCRCYCGATTTRETT